MTLQQLFEERKYLVVAWDGPLEIGSVILEGGVNLDDEEGNRVAVKVTGATTRQDWLDQAEIFDPSIAIGRGARADFYYRIVAE